MVTILLSIIIGYIFGSIPSGLVLVRMACGIDIREYGSKNIDLINVRNTFFTAITRSRAWVRIVGTGSGMTELASEIQKCIDNNYTLEINIPTSEEISKLNLLNRDANDEEMKRINKAEKVTTDLIEMIQRGMINVDDIPRLKDLVNLVETDKEE